MRAVCLMAGTCSRLRPLTATYHKALLDVGGRPLLGWQLEAFERAGLKEALLVVGYGADIVKSQIGPRYGHLYVTFVDNPYFATLNMDYSLYCSRSLVQETAFLYFEGDLLVPPTLISAMLDHPDENCIALEPHPQSAKPDTLVMGSNRRVQRLIFAEHGDLSGYANPDVLGEFICMAKFSAEASAFIFNELERTDFQGKMKLYSIFDAVFARWPTGYVTTEGAPWIEIDTHEDLRNAQRVAQMLDFY